MQGFLRVFQAVVRCGVVLLLVVLPWLAAADEPVVVEGVKGTLRDNLDAYLGKVSDDDLQNWPATQQRLQAAARNALESMGYYEATVRFSVDRKRVRAEVKAGEPVLVASMSLAFSGEADADSAFNPIRHDVLLARGGIFNHGQYESFKTRVQNLALERGYFDGDWTVHTVQVDIPHHEADIVLVFDSGPRYHIGTITFQSSQPGKPLHLHEQLLMSLVPFRAGDPYDAGKIIKLNKELLDSRYFSDLRVRADPDKGGSHLVPVMVQASTANPNSVDTGIGYSTDVGARISLNWRRSLLNQRGHSLDVTTQVSQVSHAVGIKYSIPLTHPIDDTLQLLAGVKKQEIDNISSFNTTVGVQRQRNREGGWQQVQSLLYADESFTIGGEPQGNSFLLLPGLTLTRTRSRGSALDPAWGDRQFYQIQLARKTIAADANVVYLRSGLRLLRTYDDRHQILCRMDGGAVFTDHFDALPPSLRFYAGGDQSVRGYDYQSLAPKNAGGYVLGGQYMVAGSLEYDYQFLAHWRAALFADTGNAFNGIRDIDLHQGAGVGVRWLSPVGAIRLDFAWAVSEPRVPFHLHFSMGSPL